REFLFMSSLAPTDEQLLAAIQGDDTKAFQGILATKRSLAEDVIDFDALSAKATPAMVASYYGSKGIVLLLIQAKVEINRQNQAGDSAICLASHQGHHEIVDSLIEAGADVNLLEGNGCSPLYIACLNGHDKVVKSLIKAQADVNAREPVLGCSPLYIASQEGHLRVVSSLIDARADVNLPRNTGESPLYIASQNDHYEVVDLLLKAGADVNLQELQDGCSSVYIASQNGHHKVVRLLIEAQADVNILADDGTSPLYAASHNGHHKVVDFLVQTLVDINFKDEDGYSPLYIAASNGHAKVVNSLLQAQASIDIQRNSGETPLYIASLEGHQSVVDLLIKAQANVDLQQQSGRTPLYVASNGGHHKIVNSLLKAQADVAIRKFGGESPLYIASQQGHPGVLESLLRARVDVNHQQADGRTPVYIASCRGHLKTVELLIKALADINVQAKTGKTPLYIASQNGRYEVAELLVRESILQCKLDSIQTALRCAQEFGNSRVVNLLQLALSIGDSLPADNGSIAQRRPATCDSELSQQLHSALSQSGFVDSRAALQSAVADVLQDILRRRQTHDGYFVVGSFSEGWGNSLKTLNGKTDTESDIDMMQLVQGPLLHPTGLCECGAVQTVEYKNGHVLSPGFASSPSTAWLGSTLRPAFDEVLARLLCCYPPIAPLHKDRVFKSNIAEPVLKLLQQDLTSDSSPCHVVHAAPPGKAGEQLRVSTSFLEKRLLRSLSTLQGQLFVILKWLLKKAVRHNGFKSYHAKTLTFRMVEETPPEEWDQTNLVTLTRRSLQMLIDCVESAHQLDSTDGRIMDHFFLSDGSVYLRGVDISSSEKVGESLNAAADALRDTMSNLPQLLVQFIDNLQPVTDSGRFHFHPFLVLPSLLESSSEASEESETVECEFHEIYDVVKAALVCLSDEYYNSEAQEYLDELIDKLPDCARSTRESLRAMALIRSGDREAATQVVRDCRAIGVSRGIDWPSGASASEATTDFVWQHLTSRDSAWQYCFLFYEKLSFSFLTNYVDNLFPLTLENYANFYYMNFDALLQAIHFELAGKTDAVGQQWVRDVAMRTDADQQELVVAASICGDDLQLLRLLRRRITRVLDDVPDWLQLKIEMLVKASGSDS
uniref:ANK_REP_REGION domain-containing protein n=1 Tax=Macrostomum lignano TaxID=282301 RepID=A0A1I8I5U0_9PLAT